MVACKAKEWLHGAPGGIRTPNPGIRSPKRAISKECHSIIKAHHHPSTAQRLARHCDVNLTLSHYTHSTLERQSEAVERLPDIGPQAEVARATGTDGGTVLASCLAKQERFRPIDADQSRRVRGKSEASRQGLRSPQKRPRGRFEGEKELVRAVGIEPTAYGLKVRFARNMRANKDLRNTSTINISHSQSI